MEKKSHVLVETPPNCKATTAMTTTNNPPQSETKRTTSGVQGSPPKVSEKTLPTTNTIQTKRKTISSTSFGIRQNTGKWLKMVSTNGEENEKPTQTSISSLSAEAHRLHRRQQKFITYAGDSMAVKARALPF
eukprot:3608084-Amphidinium_carterae.1